jgi:hypothetical protein
MAHYATIQQPQCGTFEIATNTAILPTNFIQIVEKIHTFSANIMTSLPVFVNLDVFKTLGTSSYNRHQ